LIDLESPKEGFMTFPYGIEYYTKPPSEFWNHYFFMTRNRKPTAKNKTDRLHIKISARLPESLSEQQYQYNLFRLAASLSIMLYFMILLRCSLFGLSFRLSIRRRLASILGMIVILPILGIGLLTFLALNASDRVTEHHLLQRTLNSIKELAILNDENLLRQMIAALELKRQLEGNDSKELDIFKILAMSEKNLNWYSRWTNSLSVCSAEASLAQYNDFKEKMHANRLIDNLLLKYIENLGLSKVTKGQSNSFSRTMMLGIMENYITPEMEEAWMVHESTIQREISHTSDTSRATLFLVRNKKNRYQLVYYRVCNKKEHIFSYLNYFSSNNPKWFSRNDKYTDVFLGVTLRQYAAQLMFGWPHDVLLSPDMTHNFERAAATRDFGHTILRNKNNIEVRAWRFKHGDSAIIAAIGKVTGNNFTSFFTSMIFPCIFGYAVLLLYFITGIITEFITGPIRIFNHGVTALNNENYGIMIENFSRDEFAKVTSAFNEMSNALRQREMIKRYVSNTLVEEMKNTDSPSAMEGRLVKATILASDIRGFTSISEKYSPAEVVEMLNSYFTCMEAAINEYGGIIDKYIGDAVQAIFYHDNPGENAALRACRAALRMREKLAQLNTDRSKNGLFTIENGIGIDTGMVVSGSVGSENGRKDFTVTGKIIEQAALLESQSPRSNSKILLSLETFKEAGKQVSCNKFGDEAMELIHV
ncbi:MAG: adenylate/guanylate cyclase domain-containing protein, partial [Candidatus Riflebacteria bacterium]|nr:adenylate/guanylate cyclase domain-containing protein [Candidatus Riflebacteria bacterium]